MSEEEGYDNIREKPTSRQVILAEFIKVGRFNLINIKEIFSFLRNSFLGHVGCHSELFMGFSGEFSEGNGQHKFAGITVHHSEVRTKESWRCDS